MESGITSEMLGAIAGVVVSWLFSYTPKLKEWYDKQTSAQKGAIMFLAMVIVSGAVYGLSCASSPFNLGVTCDQAGIWKLGLVLFYAILGNQAAYLMSPQKKAAAVIEAQPAEESPFIDYPQPVDDVQPEPPTAVNPVKQEA